jgi:hypothetical protein
MSNREEMLCDHHLSTQCIRIGIFRPGDLQNDPTDLEDSESAHTGSVLLIED